MKILQIFGAVVAVHVLAFIFIFASPGCQSGPRNIPTPDATMPSSAPSQSVTYNATTPVSVPTAYDDTVYNAPTTASAHATPTRPGSPNAAAVAPAKKVAEVAPVTTYTVVKGDSLWSIAKKNGVTVDVLKRTNNLKDNTTLQPGKKLIVPGKVSTAAPQDLATAAPAATEKANAPVSAGEQVKHTVQSGESLGVIARRYGVNAGQLAAENNITNPAMVKAGQVLIIPGKRTTPRPANTPASTTANQNVPTAVPTATPNPTAPAGTHFDIAPPPPGQDLDAGLHDSNAEVPTIKVELPTAQPPKN